MQLDNFIEETLVPIVNGINNAKDKLNVSNAIIAPGRVDGKSVTKLRYIDFEVLVSINKENKLQVDSELSGQENIGVAKGKVTVQGGYDKTSSQGYKNRICFSVPFIPEGIGFNRKEKAKQS